MHGLVSNRSVLAHNLQESRALNAVGRQIERADHDRHLEVVADPRYIFNLGVTVLGGENLKREQQLD